MNKIGKYYQLIIQRSGHFTDNRTPVDRSFFITNRVVALYVSILSIVTHAGVYVFFMPRTWVISILPGS